MRRGDRRPAPRPPLKPTLTFGAGVVGEDARALAAALVDRYSPACAWQWACAIEVIGGCTAAAPATFTLRFTRHERGGSPEQLAGFLRQLPALTAREPTEARGVLRMLCEGPVRCRPPERRGEPYWATVDLRADGLISPEAYTPIRREGLVRP